MLTHEAVGEQGSAYDRGVPLDKYRAFDGLLEGCQVVSTDLRYLYVNEAVCTQARRSREEMLGRAMTEVFPGIDQAPFYGRLVEECVGAQKAVRMLNPFPHADGTIGWFELSMQPVDEGVLILSLDLTEVIRAKEELERRVEERTTELRAALEDMGSFAHAVSHDLRAPARSVRGFAAALREDGGDSLDATCRDHLARIERGGERMENIIESLLVLANSSRRALSREPYDLGRIASEVAAELSLANSARDVELAIEQDLVARCDPSLMRIALTNLLANAWKFTARRERAHIQFFADEEDGARVFRVKDDGAGFDPSQADRLFGAFERLHKSSEFPGTGIGLATTASIIARHGGRIWADAAPDRGATFSFTISD
jgi:PAS domain S-box-containing protein